MRRVLVVTALAVAAVVALLRMSMDERAGRGNAGEDRVRALKKGAPGGSKGNDTGETPDAARKNRAPDASRTESSRRPLRLLYDDGTPAAGVTIHCASGRKLRTKIFRNGDYPQKTIWMITNESSAATDINGWFLLRPPPDATDALFYTDPDSPAVLLVPCDAVLSEYRAARRARVTGTLRDADGKVTQHVWLSAQLGRPEDYDTRNYQENSSFVGARGGLDIDPNHKFETETDSDGRFTLLLAPGPNTLSFGESGNGGSINIVVPTSGKLDLGDVIPPPKPAAQTTTSPRELHGTVTSLSGAPLVGALVRLWDGNVGPASHEVRTDKTGAWRVTGLRGQRVIAWALSSSRRHMVLPAQSSGTIQMPCNTPVSLLAPGKDEYAWVRTPDLVGFFLFEREGVFLGGEPLDSSDTLGLPLGKYRIFAVTDTGVLELATVIDTGGVRTLTGFR